MKLTVLPKPVKQNNNPVVDNNISANVQGTVMESTATKPVTVSADKVAVQSTNNNSQSNSAELPQTGNNNNEILAFIVLALASALSFLGIGKRQHS